MNDWTPLTAENTIREHYEAWLIQCPVDGCSSHVTAYGGGDVKLRCVVCDAVLELGIREVQQ